MQQTCGRKCVLVAQSCLTLYDPMGYSQPDSSVHGILQARLLEWGAISLFSHEGFFAMAFTCVALHL